MEDNKFPPVEEDDIVDNAEWYKHSLCIINQGDWDLSIYRRYIKPPNESLTSYRFVVFKPDTSD